MILVKFDDNYADEFDTNGFKLMTQDEFDNFLASAREDFIRASASKMTRDYRDDLDYQDEEVERYFGTNEGWRWRDYEDFMSSVSCWNLDANTTTIVKAIFPEAGSWYAYGMFPSMGEW